MTTVTLDDTALLRTRDAYIRPSDLMDMGEVELLCVDENLERTYIPFKASKVMATYKRMGCSHGPTLNVGLTSIMHGIRTKNKHNYMSVDHVQRIARKFKYPHQRLHDIDTFGYSSYQLPLRGICRGGGKFTLKGTDFFTMLGIYARKGRVIKNEFTLNGVQPKFARRIIDMLDKNEIKYTIEAKKLYKFKLEDCKKVRVLEALAGNNMIADELLNCNKELAQAFVRGYKCCGGVNPQLGRPDIFRLDIRGTQETLSDLAFLWNKAGINVVSFTAGLHLRLAEDRTRWADYIQFVEVIKTPQLMYELTPTIPCFAGLWVHGISFRVYVPSKAEQKEDNNTKKGEF